MRSYDILNAEAMEAKKKSMIKFEFNNKKIKNGEKSDNLEV